MFTGIIEQTGMLVSLENRGGVKRITVEAPGVAGRLREGDSLAVSGICLTALDPDPAYFHADLAQETLDKTSLGAILQEVLGEPIQYMARVPSANRLQLHHGGVFDRVTHFHEIVGLTGRSGFAEQTQHLL